MSLSRSVLLPSAIAVAMLAYACSSTQIETHGVGGSGGEAVGTGHSGATTPTVGTATGAGGGHIPGADDLACEVSKEVAGGNCVTVTPEAGGGGSGGAGGATAATAVAASSSVSTGTGMGGAGGAGCDHVFNPSICADCVVQSCCAETTACEQVAGCIACFTKDSTAGCTGAPIAEPLQMLNECEKNACSAACGLSLEYHCNPVTNYPCNTDAGEACDLSGQASFECFAPPNTQKLCESCSVTNMRPYCQPGMHCVEEDVSSPTGFCGRYCCIDPDCCPDSGSCGNKCDHHKLLGVQTDVGICTKG